MRYAAAQSSALEMYSANDFATRLQAGQSSAEDLIANDNADAVRCKMRFPMNRLRPDSRSMVPFPSASPLCSLDRPSIGPVVSIPNGPASTRNRVDGLCLWSGPIERVLRWPRPG